MINLVHLSICRCILALVLVSGSSQLANAQDNREDIKRVESELSGPLQG